MIAEQLIDLDKKQLTLLKKILQQEIPNKEIWAYGSRVTWKAQETSDLDLLIFDCNSKQTSALKETLAESNLLISVNVMEWENIPENFQKNIKEKYVVLQKNSSPKDWQEVKLGELPIKIIDNDRGENYPQKNEFSDEGHCLFLNTKNVTESGFSFSELNFITEQKDKILRQGKLQRKDLVLTTRGTIGNVAYYNEKISYNNIRINSGMIIIRPDGIDENFNYQLFKYLKNIFTNFISGSAQPQLPIRDLKTISILLPPLPEQKAIAEVLSSLDDKIDLLQKQNKTLENTAQTLFRKYFIQDKKKDWEKKPLFAKIQTNQTQIQTLEKLRDTLLPKLISGKVRLKAFN